jgi:hypothetical protein
MNESDRRALSINLLAALIFGIFGYALHGVTDSWHRARALHNVGARYTLQGFTVALTEMSCEPTKDSTGKLSDPAEQTCTATFDEFNNTNSSDALSADFTLYVGPNRYSSEPSSSFAGQVFPNTKSTFHVVFTIAPGTPPTKLKMMPAEPDFVDIFPWWKQQFFWDLR